MSEATAKFALVTGGSRGIGRAVCQQLVAAGKPVLLTARSKEHGEAACAELLAQEGAPADAVVRALVLDAASSDSIAGLAQAVAADYDQQIDLLVNNAGICFVRKWDAESFDATLRVNTAGAIAVVRALLPHLAPNALVVCVSSGLGALANVSPDYQQAISGAAEVDALCSLAFSADSPMGSAAPGQGGLAPSYSLSKAALNRAVQLLAADPAFVRRGVRVAATCPGWCRTDMGYAAGLGEPERSAQQGAAAVLWPWLHRAADGVEVNASFTRDGQPLEW